MVGVMTQLPQKMVSTAVGGTATLSKNVINMTKGFIPKGAA